MVEYVLCRYTDIVQRQKMLWDAKYQALAKQFKIPKDQDKKVKGVLRKTLYYYHRIYHLLLLQRCINIQSGVKPITLTDSPMGKS